MDTTIPDRIARKTPMFEHIRLRDTSITITAKRFTAEKNNKLTYVVDVSFILPPVVVYLYNDDLWVLLDAQAGVTQEIMGIIIPYDIQQSAIRLSGRDMLDVLHQGSIVGLL